MTHYLDFEKPLAEIEGKAEELRAMARQNEDMDIEDEAKALGHICDLTFHQDVIIQDIFKTIFI